MDEQTDTTRDDAPDDANPRVFAPTAPLGGAIPYTGAIIDPDDAPAADRPAEPVDDQS